jgi:predicted MFS family arabinose efflux permease
LKNKIAAFLVIYFSFAVSAFVFQSIPPLLPVLEESFNLTSLKSGLLMSVYSILGIVIGLFCIDLLRKFKGRDLIITANFLTFIGLILPLHCKTFDYLLIGRVLSGGGMTLLTIISPTFVSKLFKENGKASKFLGIYSTGMPIATITAFYLLPILERKFGQFFFLKLSLILSIVVIFLSILFYRDSGEEKEEVKVNDHIKFNWKLILPLSLVWLLFNAGVLSFITFGYSFAIQKKFLSYGWASTICSSTMIGGLLLGTFTGNILDKKKSFPGYLLAVGCFLISLGFLLFYFSKHYSLAIIFLIIGGGIVPTSVFSFPHIFNLKPLEKTFGIIAAFLSIGSFLGPFIVGFLFTQGKELYAILLQVLFLILASIIGIFYLTRAQRARE